MVRLVCCRNQPAYSRCVACCSRYGHFALTVLQRWSHELLRLHGGWSHGWRFHGREVQLFLSPRGGVDVGGVHILHALLTPAFGLGPQNQFLKTREYDEVEKKTILKRLSYPRVTSSINKNIQKH